MTCTRCKGTGRISEKDDPFDAGLPAGDGLLICPECHGKNNWISQLPRTEVRGLLMEPSGSDASLVLRGTYQEVPKTSVRE